MSKNEINYEAKAAFNDLNTIKDMIGKEMDAHDEVANNNENHFDSPSNRSRWKNLEEAYDRICDLMDVINVKENDVCCSGEDDDCETPC
jgi:hypothetical protein